MPVITFEEHTETLTEKEMDMLPSVIKALELCVKPHKSDEVCKLASNIHWRDYEDMVQMNGVKLRKFVNHIRVHEILPVIATSDGYSVSYNKETIQKQIQSLNERASSIHKCAEGLKKFLL